jgi:RNA polymerase sigma-70 factor (ECF subfamily)
MPNPDFGRVYDEHVWRVYAFFAYWVRSRADAEDLTQHCFERALKAWSRYDPARASVSTWLLAIARNLMVDHLRAAGSRRQQPLEEIDLESLQAAPDEHSLGIDPDLARALAELGPREREVIALRFGGDLTGPEIAALTGLSLANVQQIMSRALRRMRVMLDGTELGATAGAASSAAGRVSTG